MRDYNHHGVSDCDLGDESTPADDSTGREVFTESPRGYRARDRWARRYDALNGAPEGPDDY